MTIDDLIGEIIERGCMLHYLRQASPSVWEASIYRPLEQTANGYVNAIGYGQSNISPNVALEYAIESIEKDPNIEFTDYKPANDGPYMPSAHLNIMSIVFGDSTEPSQFKRRQLS